MKLNITKIISPKDLTERFDQVCEQLADEQEAYVFQNNKPTHVIMTLDRYEQYTASQVPATAPEGEVVCTPMVGCTIQTEPKKDDVVCTPMGECIVDGAPKADDVNCTLMGECVVGEAPKKDDVVCTPMGECVAPGAEPSATATKKDEEKPEGEYVCKPMEECKFEPTK
ncbi:MAG: hypothetical protein PHY23_10180 [Oscillospiraceae bacterium]|jgi:hypothetical protein|nr:hypothetical protein [Oscillospiraceae bacterium]